MKTVSIYAPEDLVDDFDDKVWQMKADGEIDRDASRSEVIRHLMGEWAEGNSTSCSTAIVTAN
uniref:Ribbon-helix-helix protein CopG domain-containing protein n=2 Tax=Natrinema halophilum TaxID=1699371 RepID=A0A7D5GKB2_9EURY